MKLFAFFLPQFHTIPENDTWWGEGFTEWTKVKAAKPLYHGHTLRYPLNGNYYNLLDRSTVEWQTALMNEYGVDGMIYYHYYFCGKLLLEKPAENLLKWKEIKQPFFFCWANHPWIRSWEGHSEVIMPLYYGEEADWEVHFRYLLPFFLDSRYEKKDNKPLFMVFDPDFKENRPMFLYFEKRCKDEGFDGICLIETYSKYHQKSDKINKRFDPNYLFYRQPSCQLDKYVDNHSDFLNRGLNKIRKFLLSSNTQIYNGDILIKDLIESMPNRENIINGIWFEWDNTYRHGKRGYIIKPYSKELFFRYMNMNLGKEYMFINAWNEWCEGMMLEPTEENGYLYLEWVREWVEQNNN